MTTSQIVIVGCFLLAGLGVDRAYRLFATNDTTTAARQLTLQLGAAIIALTQATKEHGAAIEQPLEDLAAAALALEEARAGIEQGPSRVGHRVTVHTKKPDERTIFGVVVGDYSDRLVLGHAEYVTPTGGQPIPGDPNIATANIAWVDVHAQVAAPEPERDGDVPA